MPDSNGGDTRALVIAGWLTGINFGVELGVGIWLGSIAVLSDAVQSDYGGAEHDQGRHEHGHHGR